ncbi:MAG: efflux RND transporter permease subunit [Alphaproteobacteria bacterium]|nr:efflux RND transporter permease subunit [Alphaproteobacteria bacterium]
MKLTEICISRPVLSTVLSLLLVVVGYVSYSRLQVRQYPKIDYPVMSVRTSFEGASPDIIESQITKPLENALLGINGIDTITSESGNGESKISIVFKVNRDIEDAANDVRDKVNRARASFPSDVANSEIRKSDADAVPMMNLVLYADNDKVNVNQMNDYAKNVLENQIQVVPGVAAVDRWGGGEFKMYIRLDPLKLANLKISPEDVARALKDQTFERPAGYLTTDDKQITVTTKAALRTEEEFSNVVIEERDGYLIRISDVASEVKFDAVENQFYVRYNGKDAVTMAVTRQSTANDLEISQAIYKLLPKLQREMPSGMLLDVASDNSIFIERSVDEVYETIVIAFILVLLVILVFLRSVRGAVIVLLPIPLSLIGACAIIYVFGFSINILTLLAMVMAIGLVVDDAIVVLENIYRYIEDGMEPMAAAYKGSKEIASAVVAMTITLAAVYLPIAMSPGETGKTFTEFAVTLAGAVLISGFVALTLSPMMCSRFLKKHAEIKELKFIENFLNRVDERYVSSLKKTSRITILLCGFGIAAFGAVVGINMKQDASTPEDQGTIKATAFPPKGASLAYISKYMTQAEKIIMDDEEWPGRKAFVKDLLPILESINKYVTQAEKIIKKEGEWKGSEPFATNFLSIFVGVNKHVAVAETIIEDMKKGNGGQQSVADLSSNLVFINKYMTLAEKMIKEEEAKNGAKPSLADLLSAFVSINKYVAQAGKIITDEQKEHDGKRSVTKLLSIIQTRGDTSFRGVLLPWEERSRSSMKIAEALQPRLKDITGLSLNLRGFGRSFGGGSKDKPVSLVIQSNKSYEDLISVFAQFASNLSKMPGIAERSVEQTNLSEEQEYAIRIDREKAASLNVDVIRVGETLDTLISGRPVTFFKSDSIRYPVTVELDQQYRKTREDISALYIRSVRNNKATMVPLTEIVSVERQLVPPLIAHVGGLRALSIWADVESGYGLGDVLNRAQEMAFNTLPEGSRMEFVGGSKSFLEESANLIWIFVFAIVFIYLVLSAQYESFIDPLIIMISVPLSLVGGILFLLVFGGSFQSSVLFIETTGTLTIFAKIGLVTLIGLITKHGILIVEFANAKVAEGKDRISAVVEAAGVRLRPILMTTFAMVLGAVPLVLADGAGSESRRQIGSVIVGGMSLGTIFTLYVVPAVYVYVTTENIKYVLTLQFLRKMKVA